MPLADELKLILGQGGLLEQRITVAAQKQMLSIEQYVRDGLAAGKTVEVIRQELLDDLAREAPVVFGEFKGDLKDAIYTASNNARALGAKVALAEGGMEKLWRWQNNGVNICEDCMERHGQVDTYANWIINGLPTMFGSRCDGNCLCTLVDTDTVLEPIKIGTE